MSREDAKPASSRMRQFWELTKPRVTLLAVFCAVIGMFLATPGMVEPVILLAGAAGIWILAGAAFAVNCLVEARIDAQMARTRARPMARGELSTRDALIFAAVLAVIGGIAPDRPPITMFCGVVGLRMMV